MIDDIKDTKTFLKSRGRRQGYYDYVINFVELDGLWLEFGTAEGKTAGAIITAAKVNEYKNIVLYGFDSFVGLPEDWQESSKRTFEKGHFKSDKTPEKQKQHLEKKHGNLKIIVGWFEDTIGPFVKKHNKNIAMLHMDCDLYSSTKFVLETCSPYIVDKTLILFDEIQGYENYRLHEYLAFEEFLAKSNLYPEWIAHVTNAAQAACILRKKR